MAAQCVELSIRPITGQGASYTFQVERELTILKLKELISEKIGEDTPPSAQKLIFAGRILDNTKTVDEVVPAEEGPFTIHLVLKKSPAESSRSSQQAPQGASATLNEVRNESTAARPSPPLSPSSASSFPRTPSSPPASPLPPREVMERTMRLARQGDASAIAMMDSYLNAYNQRRMAGSPAPPSPAPAVPREEPMVRQEPNVPEQNGGGFFRRRGWGAMFQQREPEGGGGDAAPRNPEGQPTSLLTRLLGVW
eukprot:CAMPEP_0113898950 /NCGR_PEP_ID=MMETSP0780_2-20120614/19715_1 /TAXON_ID=652834 /ORGANISM="Palpitomonas bilix" /LENGTH=252 /DNA_ID=CAMNT_0000890973 /DNA_START=33 /DNA_END=788 /DNA_ORIENTATION=+ /assembly_acc=CAM_ASM_000599